MADPNAQQYGSAGLGAVYSLEATGDGLPRVRPRLIQARLPTTPAGPIARYDIDGDGCTDFVVGSPQMIASERTDVPDYTYSPGDDGYAQIIWGGGHEVTVLRAPGHPQGHFGWSVSAWSGMVAIGAPHEDSPGAPDSGAVYLFRLSGRRLAGTPRRFTQDSPGVQGNSEPGDMFGWSLSLGRLAGDTRVADLAVGAPYENDDGSGAQTGPGGVPHSGAVTVLSDVTSPAPRGEQFRLSSPGGRYGYAVATGEWRGVAYLAAGAPGAGQVQLFRAPPGGGVRPFRVLKGDASHGFSLGVVGGDLVVGAPYGGVPSGSGLVTTVPLEGGAGKVIRGGGPGDHFGWAVTGTDSGWLLVGAPDRGTTGAAALIPLGGGEMTWLAPGDGYVPPPPGVSPTRRLRPHEAGTALDFGASVG